MTDHFEDVGAYLLGALPPDEAAAFEREMERNDALRAEVDYLRVAADALPASPIQMAPPPDLKARIMATVNAEAQLFRAAEERPEPVAAPRRRRLAVLQPGWWSLRPGIAVAASILVLAVGAGIGGLVASGGESTKQIASRYGNAKLIVRDSGHSTLTATKLKSAGPGHVYQVWLQSGTEKPKPTNALFGAGKDGTASVDVPGSMEDVDKVLVTREPEGGSSAPTTAPIIEVDPS